MKKYFALILIFVFFTSCGGTKITLKKGWTAYENKPLNFTLNYPELYTLNEEENKVTIYHFAEQPVPYFVINIYNESADSVIKKLNTKIVKDEEVEKNNLDARSITTFNTELKVNIETYYFENNGKTYSFSCLNGAYDDICETFQFIN